MTDFASWYRQRHGNPPFPWQAALAQRIGAGDWPDALTAPTGAGKTAVIDAWLWARLHGAAVPRRLVYIVDRRLVVDGVERYAEALARSLPECERPAVVVMRGGIAIENDWVREPDRPAIVVSTIDQAGSRLLFCGYGVSRRAAPIHAALLGNDALWVLDEVHLAQPFLSTLAACQAFGADLRVLPMSATWNGGRPHGLGEADRADPVLMQRLSASKPVRLVRLTGNASLSEALAQEALAQRASGAAVVGVVANRVSTARATFERLLQEGDAVLLIGRIRPADKEALLADCLHRIEVGSRARGRAPLFVVATQTVEVGADLDFDALTTECAPLSALRQRAGRVDRLGERGTAPIMIVYRPAKKDRLYGEAAKSAWEWLAKAAKRKQPALDFGIVPMNARLAAAAPPAEPAPEAPLLLGSHLELLATDLPHDLDIAPWLHGWERGAPEVYLCWRADLSTEGIAAAPPRQAELMAMPLWAVRQWSDAIADIEGEPGEDADCRALALVRWDGERPEPIGLHEARAGDTLILPCEAGGCDRYGWAPHSREPVSDVGDSERRVRLLPALYPELAADIAALLEAEDGAGAAAWRALARHAGLAQPGRTIAIPGGRVVLARQEWTSASAYRAVTLADHARAVAAETERLARAAGIADPGLLECLRHAGAGHDAGKADPRWQARVGGDLGHPLAKGPGGDDPWLVLPTGWRHEMASAERLGAAEPLTRYLIGTHHGRGRPLFPAVPDLELWRALGDWAGLRARLTAEHGIWRLALLEALLRLADWRVSESEQASPPDTLENAA